MRTGIKKIIIFIICAVTLQPLLSSCRTNMIQQKKNYQAVVDLSQYTGKLNILYGANEDDNWMDFADFIDIHGYHTHVNSEYIRVWVSSPENRESTIPLQEDGSYNFTNLDKFINAVLKSGATPFVVFAHAPYTFGKGHGEDPPENDHEFADYVQTIVKYYNDACKNNQLVKPCNVNNWYFEIWNEPCTEIWWESDPPRYVTLYNIIYPKIKSVAPNSKVGGFSGSFLGDRSNNTNLIKFLQNSQMDFISIHHYGNVLYGYSNKKMKYIKFIYHDTMLELREVIRKFHADIEIIEGEYNSDSREEYMPYLDEAFTAAWYASALIWQIKSQNVSLEMFYSGTSNRLNGGFGMWSKGSDGVFKLWPVYFMKKSFVKYNKKGSDLFHTSSSSDFLDMLAVRNFDHVFITVVNKQDIECTAYIKVLEHNYTYLMNTEDNDEKYYIYENTASIPLKPYEVMFCELQ